jgi:hypothetical protein
MEQSAFVPRRLRHDDSHLLGPWLDRPPNFAVGEKVRVASGPLAGLLGVLTTQAADGKWVLEADAARGVLICICGQQLHRVPDQSGPQA